MNDRARRTSLPVVLSLLLLGSLLGASPALARPTVRTQLSWPAALSAKGQLVNSASGKCLDDTNDSLLNDTVMTQQVCVPNHSPEQWIVSYGTTANALVIRNAKSNLVLDDVTPAEGHKIVQKTYVPGSLAQEWFAVPVNGKPGQWALANASNPLLWLTVEAPGSSISMNGDPIDQWAGPVGPDQSWSFVP